jgi:hypothetical protein
MHVVQLFRHWDGFSNGRPGGGDLSEVPLGQGVKAQTIDGGRALTSST